MLDAEQHATLISLTAHLDSFLRREHPLFFSSQPKHPFSAQKPYKDIHDPIWGTNRFSWRELALIDSPIIQRLRGIHQTGLAYHVYPAARHSRFEHSLGVVTVAARVFDAIVRRHAGKMRDIARSIGNAEDTEQTISSWRQELRLAALLHDSGHSLHSHASERVYSQLDILRRASDELTLFAGHEKGAGEVISFCLSQTPALRELLVRAESKLIITSDNPAECRGPVDLTNVSLLIIGRSKHPLLQFMGDIISSGFDADKLDYLLRDASAAGLPLKYDLERYLATVYLQDAPLQDSPKGDLLKLYKAAGTNVTINDKRPHIRFLYFDSLRLRLPKRSINTIEQITICKLMLFSYIYHHQKVRSAEGLLGQLLSKIVDNWHASGKSDEEILEQFLSLQDAALEGPEFLGSKDPEIQAMSYRLINRLLPRIVYQIGSNPPPAQAKQLENFFSKLGDKDNKKKLLAQFELTVGQELIKHRQDLGTDPIRACWKAGVRLDVPSGPSFEGMDELIGEASPTQLVRISDMFPIGKWTEAYQSHRYNVRVFAFSDAR